MKNYLITMQKIKLRSDNKLNIPYVKSGIENIRLLQFVQLTL